MGNLYFLKVLTSEVIFYVAYETIDSEVMFDLFHLGLFQSCTVVFFEFSQERMWCQRPRDRFASLSLPFCCRVSTANLVLLMTGILAAP